MTKRIIDVAVGFFGIILGLPVFLLVFAANKVLGGAKLLTSTNRIGKNLEPFSMYSFSLAVFNKKPNASVRNGEPRSTKNGLARFLKKTKLVHLPRLLNVLKGDISLVGPKPERTEFLDYYTAEQSEIFSLRPGIFTPFVDGWIESDEASEDETLDVREKYIKRVLPLKIEAELTYVRNHLLGKDLRVIGHFLLVKVKKKLNERLRNESTNRNFFLPLDAFLALFSYMFATCLRFDWTLSPAELTVFFKVLPLVVIGRIAALYYFGVYKNLWRYIGLTDLVSIVGATTLSSVLIVTAVFMLGLSEHSRSIFLIDWFLCHTFIGGMRLLFRLFHEKMNATDKLERNVLIMGAGDVGELLLSMLVKDGREEYNVVGFVDDNRDKLHSTIHGVKVIGTSEAIPRLTAMFRVDEVLITIAELSSDEMKRILNYCREANVRSRIVPAVSDLLSGDVHLSGFRRVEVADLFGRQPVELDLSAIRGFIEGKRVLVTGAGGSIGSELCRQVAANEPDCLILVDKTENYLHAIQCELESQFEALTIHSSLSNITNKQKQVRVFEKYKPEIVFHAAAHKHVPLSEHHPEEAIWNNVFGTMVISDLAAAHGVLAFVMVSTDKAINPTSVMGCTKRIAELYVQALATQSSTMFVTVRFGNVLNSNGSVVPIFMKQIEQGGPVTITHPDVERYFMSIQEAVQLILQSVSMGKSGEIFLLEMGKSIRIIDLATELVQQAGLRVHEDIEIKFTGLRPGEKLYEELVGKDEELVPTSHASIQTLKSIQTTSLDELVRRLERLVQTCQESTPAGMLQLLEEIVPEYNSAGPVETDSNLFSHIAASGKRKSGPDRRVGQELASAN